jgi:hypothetical protein
VLSIVCKVTLTEPTRAPLHFDKEGFESRDAGLNVGPLMSTVTIFMQPRYVLGEADRLPVTLMPDDSPHYVGEPYDSDYCAPCLLIRVRANSGLGVDVRLRWVESANAAMWESYGNKCATDGPSGCTLHTGGTRGDIILYVGLPLENGRPQVLNQPFSRLNDKHELEVRRHMVGRIRTLWTRRSVMGHDRTAAHATPAPAARWLPLDRQSCGHLHTPRVLSTPVRVPNLRLDHRNRCTR